MKLRVLLLAVALTLAACGDGAQTANPINATPIPPTETVATPVAQAATRTPEPGFTLIPNTPVIPTNTPQPCNNGAVFVTDVTIPDNTAVLPGAPIDKRWQVQNTGTCNWTRDYRVAYFEGNQMGAAGEHALFPAKAGTRAVVQINMIAPDVPGEYMGRWQIRDASGQTFGQVLFIKIIVQPLPTTAP
jgi:Ig-like domain from next to BRCA1 gene